MTRRENDFYPTPTAAVNELWAELRPLFDAPPWVIDPAAGNGSLLDAVSASVRSAFEIDPERASHLDPSRFDVICENYLDYPIRFIGDEYPDLYLANPPYSLAQAFVDKMLRERGPDTWTAVLLRLNFLGSQKRHDWWQGHKPDALRIISKRPSFTGDGKTDNSEYAWYVWGPCYFHDHIPALGWYRG